MAHYTQPLPEVRRDFAALVRAISTRYTFEAADRLPGFRKPALVVWSGDDRLFPLRHGYELAGRIPRAGIEVIDDAGAFIPEGRPRELAAAICRFLDDTTARRGEAGSDAPLTRALR